MITHDNGMNLGHIHFSSIVWGHITIVPRVEKIISPPKHCEHLELLCSVHKNDDVINAAQFFQNLTESEHVNFFKVLLIEVIAEVSIKKHTISINTPIQVVRNFNNYLPILKANKQQRIAFELLECDIQALGVYEYDILNNLAKLPNISLWLDDFGNNQANFDIVLSKKINLDAIKISKELMWALVDSDVAFLRALLIYLKQDHTVIVEGVETRQQVDFLSTIDGIKIQGFYFNTRPLMIQNTIKT